MNKTLKITVIIYVLCDVNGDYTHSVVGDHSDSISFGGIGNDGKYHQYDSYEGYHAYDWAEKLGMKVECFTKEVEIMWHFDTVIPLEVARKLFELK